MHCFSIVDSGFHGELMAMGLLYIDGYYWCLFRDEPNFGRFERVRNKHVLI